GVYGVSLSGSTQKDPSPRYAISMSFNADPPRTGELLQAAYDVIERARSEAISQEDLDKVKETQRQSRDKSLQQNRYWHSGMISYLLNGDAFNRLTMSYLESMLENLDVQDIQDAVHRYFDDARRIEAILHPEAYDQQ
ncbi:MAG: hypothetical protein R3330_11355, partial [Saprospiraceae bacterium]|nr:hypothetical protein [Saprospiraceae bacterium]